jgi:two-component system, NarL family, response regulator DevR
MPIKVLIADDTDIMREAMRRVVEEEPRIKIVGEASTFAQTVQAIADFKPDVLLLDLHMAEKRDFAPALVKSQLGSVDHILAVSFSNDAEARDLAEAYGAKLLLDKMKLFSDLVPAILNCETKADYFASREATSEGLQAN